MEEDRDDTCLDRGIFLRPGKLASFPPNRGPPIQKSAAAIGIVRMPRCAGMMRHKLLWPLWQQTHRPLGNKIRRPGKELQSSPVRHLASDRHLRSQRPLCMSPYLPERIWSMDHRLVCGLSWCYQGFIRLPNSGPIWWGTTGSTFV